MLQKCKLSIISLLYRWFHAGLGGYHTARDSRCWWREPGYGQLTTRRGKYHPKKIILTKQGVFSFVVQTKSSMSSDCVHRIWNLMLQNWWQIFELWNFLITSGLPGVSSWIWFYFHCFFFWKLNLMLKWEIKSKNWKKVVDFQIKLGMSDKRMKKKEEVQYLP